jgi:four helix bundle protein
MRGYQDLAAWQKAMSLVTDIYRATRTFPKEEMFGLASQLRRAAVSVPSNLAEGYSRNSRNELHHFIGQARGSVAELETQIEIAKNLGYFSGEAAGEFLSRLAEVGRMLTGLRSWSAREQ